MKIWSGRVILNIEELGFTGCPKSGLILMTADPKLKNQDLENQGAKASVHPENLSFCIYSSHIPAEQKLEIATSLKKGLSEVLNGEPLIVPSSEGLPPELPFFQISSTSGNYTLAVAKTQITLQYRFQENESFSMETPLKELCKIYKILSEEFKANFTRYGLLSNWLYKLKEKTASELIYNRFIDQKTPIQHPIELQVNFLETKKIGEIETNFWTRINSTRSLLKPEDNHYILVLYDLNTPGNKAINLNLKQLEQFYAESAKAIQSSLEGLWGK